MKRVTCFYILLSCLLFISGCSMKEGAKQQKVFVEDALECVELLYLAIEYVGFNSNARRTIDSFFEKDYGQGEVEASVKGKISSVYMAFLGKTDFKDSKNPNNETLFSDLVSELNLVENELDKFTGKK